MSASDGYPIASAETWRQAHNIAQSRITTLEAEVEALRQNQCHHGFRGSPLMEPICTPCPNCNAHSVFIGKGGYLTCSIIGCSDPGAPHKALVTARAAREATES